MVTRKPEGGLSRPEKRIVKGLLEAGWRNQDIQALVNTGRIATINGARVSEVKKSSIVPAPREAVDYFIVRKNSYDPQTGLNLFDDERLIRSREAMALAVQTFNSPSLRFKTELFAVLANIAWTYLLHEFYARDGVPIEDREGRTLLLGQMVERRDCPLSKGMKNNLKALKLIRDEVEHRGLGRGDRAWLSLFQACCLNYETVLTTMFGERVSLRHDLSVALQFARFGPDQAAELQGYEIPPHIAALDARLEDALSDEERADIEYRFRVVYSLDSASKSRAHIQFLHPGSVEAEAVRNVLVKFRSTDETHPYKPGAVVKLVRERSGQPFTGNNHTQAWKKFKVRPGSRSKEPAGTSRDYCVYHPAHCDYTYSEAWVEMLVKEVSMEEGFAAIRAVKV